MYLLNTQTKPVIYENISGDSNCNAYISKKNKKILIVFGNIPPKKKFLKEVSELYIGVRKLNKLIIFIFQSFLKVPKDSYLHLCIILS